MPDFWEGKTDQMPDFWEGKTDQMPDFWEGKTDQMPDFWEEKTDQMPRFPLPPVGLTLIKGLYQNKSSRNSNRTQGSAVDQA